MSDDEEIAVYDEIEIEDMTFDEAQQLYHYPCPCGDRFQIALDDLLDQEDIAICPSCSLMIRVIFDLVSFVVGSQHGSSKVLTSGRRICPSLPHPRTRAHKSPSPPKSCDTDAQNLAPHPRGVLEHLKHSAAKHSQPKRLSGIHDQHRAVSATRESMHRSVPGIQ